jgi:hypothetical protein
MLKWQLNYSQGDASDLRYSSLIVTPLLNMVCSRVFFVCGINFFINQGIVKKTGTNVNFNKTTSHAQLLDPYLKSQGHTWRSKPKIVCYRLWCQVRSMQKNFHWWIAQIPCLILGCKRWFLNIGITSIQMYFCWNIHRRYFIIFL